MSLKIGTPSITFYYLVIGIVILSIIGKYYMLNYVSVYFLSTATVRRIHIKIFVVEIQGRIIEVVFLFYFVTFQSIVGIRGYFLRLCKDCARDQYFFSS